jgi:predicted GIY-YIG superfamily endonuclease
MVYGGEHATLERASERERQLKRWSREKKQALVHHSARSASIG